MQGSEEFNMRPSTPLNYLYPESPYLSFADVPQVSWELQDTGLPDSMEPLMSNFGSIMSDIMDDPPSMTSASSNESYVSRDVDPLLQEVLESRSHRWRRFGSDSFVEAPVDTHVLDGIGGAWYSEFEQEPVNCDILASDAIMAYSLPARSAPAAHARAAVAEPSPSLLEQGLQKFGSSHSHRYVPSTGSPVQAATNESDGETESPSSQESSDEFDPSTCVAVDVRDEILATLLEEFIKLYASANRAKVVNRTGASDGSPAPSSSTAPNPRQEDDTTHASIKRRSTGKRKRADDRGSGNEDSDDDDDGDSPKRPSQKSRTGSSGKLPSRLLACPFYKWKPHTHRQCRNKVLRKICRMKYHLWRGHLMPIHCDVCFMEFDNTQDRATHIRQRNCELRDPKAWDCITEEQRAQIKRRVKTKMTEEEQWYEVYRILFPGDPVPDSPYIDGFLADEVIALQEFMAQQWPPIFNRLIKEKLPDELRNHEEIVREFSHYLFEEAVNHLLHRCEASQDTTGTSDSAYESRSDSAESTDMATSKTQAVVAQDPTADAADGVTQGVFGLAPNMSNEYPWQSLSDDRSFGEQLVDQWNGGDLLSEIWDVNSNQSVPQG